MRPNPVELCFQYRQETRAASEAFVNHWIQRSSRFEDSEEGRNAHEFITREANFWLTINSYERRRKTDKSDGEAERLYAAMCKAYNAWQASRGPAIQYRDEMMPAVGSVPSWLAQPPL
jgi:hypothetical protein